MEQKNDNGCQHFTQLYISFFTERPMVDLPTVFHLKGCICDSVLHSYVLYPFYPLFLSFLIMESLSDIECGLAVLFIKLLSYSLLGFQFLIFA